MTPSAQLRPARADDLPGVEALLEASNLPADGLAHAWPDGYVVAEGADGICGVAGVERYGRFGLLRSVAVRPGHRGTGLGDALVRDRLGWAAAERLAAVYLLTTTAAAWFPRYGFVPAARDDVPAAVRASVEFASACPASAAVLVRALA